MALLYSSSSFKIEIYEMNESKVTHLCKYSRALMNSNTNTVARRRLLLRPVGRRLNYLYTTALLNSCCATQNNINLAVAAERNVQQIRMHAYMYIGAINLHAEWTHGKSFDGLAIIVVAARRRRRPRRNIEMRRE